MTQPDGWRHLPMGAADVLSSLRVVSFICEVSETRAVTLHDCADEVLALSGISRDALRSDIRPFLAALSSRSRRRLKLDERRHAADLSIWRGTYDLLHPTNGLRRIFIRALPHRLSVQSVVWRGLAEDITGDGLAANLTDERDRRALEAGSLSVWEATLDATDEAGGTVLFERWLSCVHPEDRERVRRDLLAQARALTPLRAEFRVATDTASWCWQALRARVSLVRDGQPVRMIGVLARIDDRKGLQLRLEESETRLRALFEMAPVGMSRNGMDGRFLEMNRALLDLLGYDAQELRRLTYWDLTPARFAAQEAEQLMALETRGRYGPYEKEFVHHSGKTVPVRLNGVLIQPVGGAAYIWSTIEDISARHGMDDAATRNAQFDPITGLANRSLAGERTEQRLRAAIDDGHQLALLNLDLDHFMPVNTTYGHSVGDMVLREVARRLVATAGDPERVARVGGDEFSVLVENPADGEIDDLCRRIIAALSKPLELPECQIRIGASIGVAVGPTDAAEAQDLNICADLALQLAKSAGGGAFRRYVPTLTAGAGTRLRVETALYGALAQNELELHYQPQIDLTSGRCTSLEALIRWRRSDGILIPPDSFIPVAEQSNLIFALGDFVLNAACREITRWRGAGLHVGRVAVNLSAREFQDPQLAARIEATLARHGVPPELIEIEITESAVMSNTVGAIATLGRLRALGVGVALDDFGTGHSSLAYLKRLPITALKVDRSFLEDFRQPTPARAIYEAIVRLGQELALEVVAEGVETTEQAAFVRAVGCTLAQGFYFARPMPAANLLPWLAPQDGGPAD